MGDSLIVCNCRSDVNTESTCVTFDVFSYNFFTSIFMIKVMISQIFKLLKVLGDELFTVDGYVTGIV